MVKYSPTHRLNWIPSIGFSRDLDCFSVDVEISRSPVEKCETPSHEAIVIVGSGLLFCFCFLFFCAIILGPLLPAVSFAGGSDPFAPLGVDSITDARRFTKRANGSKYPVHSHPWTIAGVFVFELFSILFPPFFSPFLFSSN